MDSGTPNFDARPTPTDLLKLDIDLRLADITTEAWADGGMSPIQKWMRMAYAAGYLDALCEEERGKLCRDHGLRLPHRKAR